MKVLLNIESLNPLLSGIGTYTLSLARNLQRHPKVSAVHFFNRNGFGVQDNLNSGRGAVPMSFRRIIRNIPFSYGLRDRISGRLLRRERLAHDGYLYHEPNYLSVPYDGPRIVTVSDLSHLRYPEYHPPKRVRRLECHLPSALASAHQVICHSKYVRDEIVDVYGLPEEKISVVYHGVSDAFRPHTADEIGQVLRRYNLDGTRYLLSVGTLEPRKNLVGLITAYSLLPASLRRSHPLVIVGPKGWLTKRIEQAMTPLIREGTLHWVGYVPMEDLPAVYAGAHAFAYPSFYEGFGLPLIEAMASGVPLLTSNRAAMPEIAGSAGILVDPEDVDDIARGLRQLLLDDEFREKAVSTGLERVKRFRWENTVDETVNAYRKALGGTSG